MNQGIIILQNQMNKINPKNYYVSNRFNRILKEQPSQIQSPPYPKNSITQNKRIVYDSIKNINCDSFSSEINPQISYNQSIVKKIIEQEQNQDNNKKFSVILRQNSNSKRKIFSLSSNPQRSQIKTIVQYTTKNKGEQSEKRSVQVNTSVLISDQFVRTRIRKISNGDLDNIIKKLIEHKNNDYKKIPEVDINKQLQNMNKYYRIRPNTSLHKNYINKSKIHEMQNQNFPQRKQKKSLTLKLNQRYNEQNSGNLQSRSQIDNIRKVIQKLKKKSGRNIMKQQNLHKKFHKKNYNGIIYKTIKI